MNAKEIINVIQDLTTTNSVGFGNKSIKVVKQCTANLSHPFEVLVNNCFRSVIFPDLLKISSNSFIKKTNVFEKLLASSIKNLELSNFHGFSKK